MSILVTGGTGFIGAEIVRMLIAAGEGPITVAQRSTDLGRLADLAAADPYDRYLCVLKGGMSYTTMLAAFGIPKDRIVHVMAGRASDAQIAGFLVGLAMKGERAAEIVGLARTMRGHGVRLSRSFDDVFDTCGTGGDRSGTFNISSAAAVVIAACGVVVAKHGNRSVSSRCGSADVFEALGVTVAATRRSTSSPAT